MGTKDDIETSSVEDLREYQRPVKEPVLVGSLQYKNSTALIGKAAIGKGRAQGLGREHAAINVRLGLK